MLPGHMALCDTAAGKTRGEAAAVPGCSSTQVMPSPARSIDSDLFTAQHAQHGAAQRDGAWHSTHSMGLKRMPSHNQGAERTYVQRCFAGTVCIVAATAIVVDAAHLQRAGTMPGSTSGQHTPAARQASSRQRTDISPAALQHQHTSSPAATQQQAQLALDDMLATRLPPPLPLPSSRCLCSCCVTNSGPMALVWKQCSISAAVTSSSPLHSSRTPELLTSSCKFGGARTAWSASNAVCLT